VFERDLHIGSRVGARDWAVACHWSGPILAKLVGEEKWSRIQEVGVDPNVTVEDIRKLPPVKLLHGVTGEPLAEMTTDGEPFFRFLRSRLVAFLADGIDVRYSKTLDRFSCEKADGSHQGIVTAYFTDGTEVRGRLLIGADGVRSRVRSVLFEHDPKQAALSRLPYAATFVNASFTADQARYIRAAQCHPFGCAIPHPKGLINLLCILDADQAEYPETWRFCFYVGYQCSIEEQDKKATPRHRLQEAKQMVKDHGIGDPLKSVYEWVRDDTETVYYTKVANWDPSLPQHKWDNHDGLVTLAGDACHPMTYRKLINPVCLI
jgi:2-polyprenyl-6-methoxyphenol hydroxylase-like FAD-dependent oxidoreductase